MPTHCDLDVLIPCWGRYAEFLPATLASCPADTAVVAGDDDACAVAAVHGARHVLLDPTDRRCGPARDAAIRATTRPLIAFIDADDTWLPSGIGLLLAALTAAPDAVAAVGLYARDVPPLVWPPVEEARAAVAAGGMRHLLARNTIPASGGIVLRRDRLPAGPLFPDLFDEDWHAAVALRAVGEVVLVEQTVLAYSVREQSVSRRNHARDEVDRSHALLVDTACRVAPERATQWAVDEQFAAPRRRARDMADLASRVESTA